MKISFSSKRRYLAHKYRNVEYQIHSSLFITEYVMIVKYIFFFINTFTSFIKIYLSS